MRIGLRGLPGSVRKRWHERQFRFMVILYGSCVAIVGFLAIPAILTVSSSPAFCAACHSMNPEFQTWKKSSHSQITCYGCHGPKSVVQLVYGKALVDSKGPYQEVTGRFEKPVNETSHLSQEKIPAERCERCHSNENRSFTFSRGITMNHGAHKKAGIDCTVCHNRVVHRGAERYEPLRSWDPEFRYKDFLTMSDGCRRCHSRSPETRDPGALSLIKGDGSPPSLCPTCHTSDFELPRGHGTVNWSTEHGIIAKQDFGYCFGCHDAGRKFDSNGKQWCTICHDQGKADDFRSQAGLTMSPAGEGRGE